MIASPGASHRFAPVGGTVAARVPAIIPLIALGASWFACADARAQCPPAETGRLLAAGGAGQSIGSEVALFGTTALLGRPEATGQGVPGGGVPVFEWNGSVWSPGGQIPAPAGALASFGSAISIDADTVVIGAPAVSRVFVYARQGSAWALVQTIDDPAPSTPGRFGREVDVRGDVLVVSSPHTHAPGVQSAGRADVFERVGGSFVHRQTLRPTAPSLNGFFGCSVAADHDAVLIGCYGDSALGATAGAGYLYRRQGTSWTLEATLRGSDTSPADALGFSCELQGDTAVLGAFLNDGPAGMDAGSAYVFTRTGSTWVEQAVLHGTAAGANMGQAIALDGDRLLASTKVPAVSVRSFMRSGGVWSALPSAVASPPWQVTGLGAALALEGSHVIAGAPGSQMGMAQGVGQAIAFELATPPAIITQQPASVTIARGQPASIAVLVSAPTPLKYQWRFQGAPIPEFPPFSGTNSPTLAIERAMPVHEGEFDVVISTICGAIVSQPAALTVALPCIPDFTTTAIPGSPGYGLPNGVVTNDDFFYCLVLFSQGC